MHWWGVMCLAVSAAFFVNAWSIVRRRRRFLAAAQPAQGTVVEIQIEGVGKNRVAFPVFEFAVSGEKRRAKSLMGTGFQAFTVGQQVPVLYDPADPSQAEVNTRAVLWGTAMLRSGFGALFLLMGLFGLTLGLMKR